MEGDKAVLQEILRQAPGSIRALARAAGVSETLLRAIRDGERRMTPETRRALVAALRGWAGTCERLAGELEAADPDTGGDDAT